MSWPTQILRDGETEILNVFTCSIGQSLIFSSRRAWWPPLPADHHAFCLIGIKAEIFWQNLNQRWVTAVTLKPAVEVTTHTNPCQWFQDEGMRKGVKSLISKKMQATLSPFSSAMCQQLFLTLYELAACGKSKRSLTQYYVWANTIIATCMTSSFSRLV